MIGPLAGGFLLAQSCSGPWCGPDTGYERPAEGVLGDSAAPATIVASDGALLVAWEYRTGGEADVLFNRREPGSDGRWLESPRRLDGDEWGASRSIEPRIAAGADGLVLVVWQDARGGRDDLWLNRSTDGGLDWEGERRLPIGSPGAWTTSMPALTIDHAGRVLLAWEDQRDIARDLYLVRSLDGGATWAPELRIDSDSSGEGVSYHPQFAEAGQTLLVSWWDERDGQADVYVRRSTDGGGTWAAPEARLDPGAPGEAQSRDARMSAAGERVTVVWEEGRGRRGATILGRSSTDAGVTWAPPVTYGEGDDPVVAARPDGPAHVAWTSRTADRSAGRTSIGGRIVDIPIPIDLHLTTGRLLETGRPFVTSQPGLDAQDGLWMGGGEEGMFAARAGAGSGRGAVQALRASTDGNRGETWRSMAILQFGAHLYATATDVRARSLTGAAGPDGALHLVWIASYGDAADLGYTRLQR